MPLLIIPKNLRCRAYSRLAVDNVDVVYLNPLYRLHEDYGPCSAVLITVEDNAIRRKYDGEDPTTGVDGEGATLADGSAEFVQGGKSVANLALIAAGAGAAVVHVDYFYEK